MSALSPGALPARQRRKAERPQELLDAALTHFISKGLAATRMDDVAREAGVSKGTLYLYFPSKDELFKAVVRNHLSEFIAEGIDLAQRWDGPAADLLHLLAESWWLRVGSSKASGMLKLIMAEVGQMPELAQFYVDEVITPTHELLGGAIRRGIERGEFRKLDVPGVVHALMAVAQFLVLHAHCTAAATHNPYPLQAETYMKTQLELLLRGLIIPAADVRPAANSPETGAAA